MRENASRLLEPTGRFSPARFFVSMWGVLFAAFTAANAATDFSDYSVFGSASSTTVSSIRIGPTTDSETAITANTTATGDDVTGSDDEDGVTVPASLVAGTSGSLTVNVTNSSGSTVFLNAWIDYNRNGVLTDSGEQIATNTTIATGTSNSNRTLTFTVPATASLGTAGVRVRLTSTSSPGPIGLKGNGEVEDYITTIVCPTITLSTSSLSGGAVGRPYSQTLAATGGTGSYTWALTSGTMPAGLSLNTSTGEISGTPTTGNADGVSLTFTATDGAGCQGSATLLLQIVNGIFITPSTLLPPTVGTAYSQVVTAQESGFDVQQAFSSSSVGTLAAADAVLAGTNRTSNWTGSASTISYNSSGAGGGHYTDTDFPAGPGDNFALKATGIITIPTAGAWTFATNSDDGARVKIDGTAVINDDTQHATTDKFGTVTLTAGTHVIELVFFELAGGEAIELFAAPGTLSTFSSAFKLIGASDGLSIVRSSPTYTWSLASGSLPAGLTLNAGTGLISGTPTSASNSTFTLRATDNYGYSNTQSYTLQACSAVTLSPATLSPCMAYSAYSQTFSITGGTAPYAYTVSSGSLPAGLSLDTAAGVISGRATSTAAASFTIAVTDINGCSASRSYTLTPASPTDFGDYSGFGNASSALVSTLRLGALTDAESSPTTNATATGDNITDLADEDGVTLPAYLAQGTSNSITVNLTNTTGATAYLNAWIDYNNNGLLTDSGEQIATNTIIATGTSNSNRTVSFTVPAGATAGLTGVRVRLTSTSSPGATGASGNGEVEDYAVNILPPTDFGDDSAFDIAGSTLSASLRMGALVDGENSNLANAAATGDDTNGSDDEDGVTLPASVIQGQPGVTVTVNVTNTTGADAYLNGWIDFNNNGVLTDSGEQIVLNDLVSTGTSGGNRSYTFTVPSSASTGVIGARFRLTSSATPDSAGISGTGEVEDYAITVLPASDHGDYSRFADASSYNSSDLTMGDLEDTEYTPVTNLAATGDDITNINDEDGVTLQAILVQGQAGVAVTVKLNNTTGAPAYLNGWVDFNNNGSVADSGEQVIADAVVDDGTTSGYQTYYFDVPSNATTGTVGARFRLTSAATPGPTGASAYGEVEDYTTTIVAPSSNFRDYFYTIRAVGTRFYLDEISVYNPNSSTPTVSVNPGILDLNAASPGFNTGATDAMMNGLALDWLNRRFYWAATSTGSSGYNFSLYTAAYDNVSKTWSYQLVTNSARTNVPLNTGSPVSGSASSGAFPRAAFYNGEYYAGGQLSNNVAVWHLNSTGLGLTSPAFNDYTNFFHLSQTFNGGDFVIRPQDGLLVTSTVISNANTLFNQFIGDGMNASGPAAKTASVDTQIPYSSNSSVQIAGVGGVSRLYALGSAGTNIYRIDSYDTTSPKAVKVGPLPTASYTDLSEGISSSVTSLGVKGIVYNDPNGLADGILSGTGTNASGTLYAMLVDTSGNLVDSFPVKSDGTFILGGASANTSYRVVLSTSYGSLGSAAPAAAMPTGWLNAGEFLGSGSGSDGTIDGRLSVTVGNSGIVNATFGVSQTLSIGDLVWNDSNNSGTQDAGESGIGGVTAQLWAPGSDNAIGGSGTAADTLLATTTTDGTGAYSFTGLAAGKYFVTVTPPTLYSVVSSTVAGDDGNDGDNNGSQPGGRGTKVYSPVVTLAQNTEPGSMSSGGGNTENTIDFGLLTAMDYGDYASFASAGSALVSNLFIGTLTDSEYSANTNAGATGDDLTGQDDEDGVQVPAAYQGSSSTLTVTVTNLSGSSAFLHAWVDFNGNGVLTDPGEQIASNILIANGTNGTSRNINFTTPATAVLGTVGLRVRLTSVSTPGSTGNAGNGEVEDHLVSILPAVTDFGDNPAFAAASQIASTEIFVGTAATDAEALNPATGTANADDTTGTDDEDLVIPSVVSGGDQTMSIPITLSGSVMLGRIGVWADWNGDGDAQDANETVALNSSGLIGGSNTVIATFSPPIGTTTGTKFIRIIVVEGTAAPAFNGSSSLKGEVEDYAITVTAPTMDYGDLPDSVIGTSASNYQTLTNDNGPAHIANSLLRLGATVDAEGNGQPNSTATGDGADEDGVATLPTLTQNLPATLTVSATNGFGSAGFLKAWIDWNNDGNLTANEELGPEISVPNGTSNGSFSFSFTVPSSAVLGASLGLRVRLASTTIPASNGIVGTGEVEDYLVTVNASTADFGDYPNFAAASRVASTQIKVGTAATDVETSNPASGNATADDTTGTDDEDLTMPTLQIGTSSTLTIPVTLTSPVTSGRIAVFADWNGDNDVLDTNETVSLSTSSLVTGTNTITATLSPPAGITGGTKYLRIIVNEGSTAPSFSGSSALQGEVEDYAVTVNAYSLDYGDLPDTGTGTGTGNYQTLSSDSGPSHTATSGTLRLGATVDAEADGQPNATATGDGADEDGITSMPVFNRGQPYTIPVSVFNNTGSTARIFGFMDWNNDGDFADAGEALTAVAVSSSASQQSVNITGTTPGTAVIGTFGARFRLATATTLASTGTTGNGEVEDYMATGACPTLTITPATLPATTQYSAYSQTLSAGNGTAPYTWTVSSGALPGGLTLSSAGGISGTVASASGAYVFTARATDANGCTATQSYTISVGSGGMSVGNLVFLDENNNGLRDPGERGIPNVPVEIWSAGADGRVNSADDQPVTSGNASVLSSGGMLTSGTYGTIASGFSTLTARTDWTGAYQFTELPTGVYYLKITPPNKSVFSSKYGTGTTTYSLNLDFPLASSSFVLIDNGIDNDSNGVQTAGSFTSSSDALLAGVGAAVFSMPFTLATATEPGTSNLGSDEYTIDFGLRPCPAIGITPLTVPAVSSGVAYSTTLSATGGTAPYTYAITQGTLPSGLSMSGAGVISGTTSTTGTSAITVRATDARGCQGFTTIQLSVTTAMSITTSSLPNGTEGTAYTSTTLAATGGSSPYQNWRVSTGVLPTGMTLNSSTGVLSGTPTSPGTYVVTVAVDDALVTPASVSVTNGSVETDAWSAITFTPRTSVTGWTLGNSALSGTTTAVQLYGVNDSNASNSLLGQTPAGLQYLASPFVDSWASQTVSGFTVGRPYTLRVRYAMRGAFANPATAEAQPPFYSNALWVAGYNASAASLFGPASVNFPAANTANFDNWATLDVPFVPQTSSMVFSYGLDGMAIDDVQFIPTVAATATATKQFTFVISGNRDWGDLPDTGIGTGTANYQTTNSDSGPSHYRNSNLRLGATLDIESDGQPDASATGDDLSGTDDEDAITTLPTFARGQSFSIPVSVFNNTGTSANVFAFIDWNNDGDFLDPSEALSSVSVSSGSSQQSVNVTGTVPGNAALAQIGLRVRLSTAGSLGAFGVATNGEVEDYLVTTTCPTVSITPATLPGGTLSSAYSQTISASGGTAPYTYALSSGTLPSGVTLNATTGVLSGTPNVAGTFSFTLSATDANGCAGSKTYSVVMTCPSLTITPAALTAGTVGTAYSQTLSAAGGASPYGSWTVISGSLPAGLTLNAGTGVISGTPTTSNGAGASFTVRTTDANGCQGSQAITLKICPVVTVSPTSLTAPTVNSAYTQTLTASGGAAAYTFTVSTGTLPAGLSLSSAGILSGTPTATSSSTFTITATDANGCQGSRSYTLAPSCPLISVAPATPARATVGTAYSQAMSASGGLSPYGSWTVTRGTLPAGLSLNASTGVISGTPTTSNGAGTSVTIRVTDANGCTGSQAVTLQICPVLTLTPASLPNGTINTSYSQTLTTSGGASPYTYTLGSGSLPAGLTLSSGGVLSGTPTSTTAATFTVTATDANGCTGSISYTVTPAPDSDYGDYSLFANASSRMNSTLRIGALTDVEASATTNTAATGDDTTGSDDEDGVTLPATITQGGASSLTVNVSNTSGATVFLNAWIDFNQNGSLSDAGEQIATNTLIVTGTSNSNRTVSFTAPANAVLGTAGVRVRLTSTSSPGPIGASGNGEVEDYVTTIVAPTTDYGDFSLFADAYSTGSSSLRLGALQDLEGSATKDSSAQGDDTTGTDDEDSVTFPSMTAGQPMSLPVTVTNLTGSTAYLNAWIDFNNNGVLTDAGEQIATNVNIITGTSGGTVTLNFNVPTNAVTAAALIGARFRLTNVQTPGSTGGVGIGEVEDHTVVILAPLTDFGDFSGAPSVSNTASTNLRLGALVDTEYAATTDVTATGDDLNGVDDEDGVTLPAMTAGAPATVSVVATNSTGSPAYLNAWIDFNNNGVFTDSGEQIATNTSVVNGATNSTFNISTTVPAAAVTGTGLGVRVRISNDISPGSTGSGGVGEVEDYVVSIAPPTTDFGDYSLFSVISGTTNSRLRLGALTDTEYSATTNATATGDDITGADDEDGVTLPSMIAGAPATIPIVVTNTTGSSAYLNAWIDYNGNGSLADAGEQIATNTAITTGTSNSTFNLSTTIPATTLTGVPLGVRVLLTSASSPATSGNVGTGEIEDYVVTITAPTTDFGDFSSFADASQGVSPSLRMGASVDAEYTSTRNSTATGDDITGINDEDGVTLPSMTAGQTLTVPVVATNSSGAMGYLNAWIDFDNNGTLAAGEQIATNLNIPDGSSDTTFNITFTVPLAAVTGTNVGARFRLSAPTSPGPTGANAAIGEIEDYVVRIAAPTLDFGDNSGIGNAASTANSKLRIGALVDAEFAANNNATATGDDLTGSDDEDGVTIPTLTAGSSATIPVVVSNTTGSSAYLNAWIDYNNNGLLTDSGEQIATNTAIATGTSNATRKLNITVPLNAAAGTPVGVRVRLTSVSSPGATGTSSGSGEVEDYVVSIVGPTTDYGDWSGIADASNTIVSSLRLGALTDAEFSSTKNATATGDDNTNLADEDGVDLPAMTAGGTYQVPVTVTNTSGSTAYLNAWFDFNNNGSFADAGEQVANNVSITSGQTNATLNQSVIVPAAAVTGTNLGARFRLTSTSTPGATGTGGGNGEVEDYVVNIAVPTTDFGDFSRFAGASSTANSKLRLGALVDTEFSATTDTAATGDDLTGSDDEDGVTLPSLTAGAPATIPVIVTNTSGSAASLNAWIDFNNNGVLTDAGEQIATDVSIPSGITNSTQNLNITVPAGAVTGTDLGVRFRLTSVSSPGSTGAAGTGEVEDYVVSIISPPLDYGDWSGIGDAASTADSTLRLGALVDTEYVSTLNLSATGDDITGSDDEDGVTLPSLTAGAPATIPVIVTNTSGSAAYLNVWIDYNNNGALTDAGEQIATDVSIPSGITNSTQNLNITVPAGAVTGSNLGVRVRLTSVSSPGITGTAGRGEVEDYVTSIAVPTTDFGDWSGAADASSLASSNLRMGALADTEYVSTLNASATGDDITGSDDEDGVTLPSQTPGTAGNAAVVVTNNTGAPGYLNAWIDFNNNGSFADAGEQIATNTVIATGTNGAAQAVNFIVPVGAVPGQRGARFRLTSTQSPTSVGASGTGEVEDSLVTITCLPISVSPATLTTPTVGTATSQTVTATGGLAPYTYSVGTGTLPAGLALSSGGVLSGTPTSSSAATFSIVATDSYGCTGTRSYTVTPVCPAITVNPVTLPSGTVGTSYSQTLTATGGTAPYTFTVASGTLPAGLTLNTTSGISAGLISGTPTTGNGAGVSVTFRATDANGCTATRTVTMTVCPVITLTPATVPAPVVGTAYSQTLAGSGGAAPYTFSLASGTLPSWVTLSSSGVLGGTPTSTASATFSVRATDANGCTSTLSYTLTPVCPAVTITPAALAQGTVGTAYSQTLTATGGTAPYGSWTVTSGTLPTGLSLDSGTGVISGTPTATASPATTITVRVNDTYGCQGTRSVTLQICPAITLSPATLTTPVIGVAYSQSLSASSGASPYSFTLASGSLPAWATLSTAGVITGTPTSGTPATFSVRATDANGCSGTASYTLAPNCPAIAIAPATPPQSTVGSLYSQTLTATGGTAPYGSWTVTSGTLPAGLFLNPGTGIISGTPTTANGTGVSVSIRTTDANGCQGTQAITLQVCPVITLAPATPATPTVSTAYSQTFTASGGAGSYTFSIASGTLPSWASLSSAGVLSGTPDSPNSATFTVKATDANGCSGTQSCTLTPVCPAMAISPTTAVTGTVGSIYSQTLTGSGGTAPYSSWTVTSGTLPAGLSLNASTGVISGTPTASTGPAVSVTVRTTDARGCQVSAVISLKVCPVIALSPATLPTSTAGTSYTQTISGSGGVVPYAFAVSAGTLPAGLTLSSAGALTGTPTATASATFTITATDANGCTGTRSYTMAPACPVITVTPATLPNGTVNTAYSQPLASSGGIGTITWSISSGSLPAGLSLNTATGVISGTPTSTSASTFTVRATDSNACTGSTTYTVTPACPVVTVTPATLASGTAGTAYSQTLSGAGGIAPYTSWTVTSGSLPSGLTLNSTSGVISGTPATSNGAGVNVTIRTTDANGCQGSSVIAIKICPVITQSPSTLAAPVVGTAYSQSITPAGGVSPYTFTLASGSLPAGLTLSSSGTISGTTTGTASASFTVKATAADGCSGTAAYTLSPVCPTLALSPSSAALPVAYLGAPYTQALTASGGTAPYTYALQSGDLPGGVLISSSGTLSGTPTAKGSFPVTIRVTDANACAQSFNLTLQVRTLSVGNLVYEDSNNNGLKETSEPGVAGATVQLFSTGDDNAIGGSGTAADTQVGSDFVTTSTGAYLFSSLPAGNYYVKVTPPADYLFTGGTASTADDNVDNNNDGAQPGGSGTPLFSPVINLAGGAESTTDGDSDSDTNLTVDFGLWSSVAVGNFIFLDINGDGRRNEGESLGNIYVELYAQGATPGVDDPVSVGTSGCSCKGRYYLEGLNPGTYFLHIPASQFTAGSPLEGLLPMSSVVAGDDDVGQDLIFNSNPAVNGARTAIFTLRPGFCPVGAAESGAEGSTDDDMDARVDLTRDLGIVAPAGTGFAASTAIRRYIVTGGFTASVLTGANTFATWSQGSDIGGATADPDEDGSANLMEYALGTDPASPLQPNRFFLTHDASTGSLVAQLTVPTATHDDLIISLETLTDLGKAADASAWKKLSMAATTTINADGTLTRSYSNLEKLLVFKGIDAGYIRLRIDLDANRDGISEATVTSAIQGWSRQSFATGSRTFSMPLLNAAFFTGRAVSVSGGEVMLPAIITLPAGSFYLEALDGPLAGQRFEIDATSSSGNTVVLQGGQSLSSLAGAHISIRQHHTLGELLPSAAFSSEDRVLFFDPAAGNYTTLTNSNGYWLSDVLSMNARPFAAHEAAMVQIRGSGNVLMFTGEVRQTSLATTLVAGTQLIAPGWPVATPAPVSGLTSGLTPDSADRFRLWDGDTTPSATDYTGYYLDGTTTPPAWKPQTTPAPAATVQPFHGFFLIRNAPLQMKQDAPW